jgi:hypothetical protein
MLRIQVGQSVAIVMACIPAIISLSLYSIFRFITRSGIVGSLSMLGGLLFRHEWNSIGWGGLPFLWGVFLTIGSMMLAYRALRERGRANAIVLALLISASLATYPVSALFVGLWIVLLLLEPSLQDMAQGFRKLYAKALAVRASGMLVAVGITAVLSLPVLIGVVSIFTSLPAPGSQGGFPLTTADSAAARELYLFNMVNPYAWVNFVSDQGAFARLSLAAPMLALAAFFLGKKVGIPKVGVRELAWSWLLFGLLLVDVLYVRYLDPLTLPLGVSLGTVIPTSKVFFATFIPVMLLTILSIIILVRTAQIIAIGLFKRVPRNKALAGLVLLLMVGGSLSYTAYQSDYFTSGWISNPAFFISETRNIQFSHYAITTQDDLQVFNWIETNTSPSSRFLVSLFDSGEYLHAPTGRQAIGPPSPSEYWGDYPLMLQMLLEYPTTLETLSLLKENNISYIFVGEQQYQYAYASQSTLAGLATSFNETSLAQSAFLNVVAKFGGATLFEVSNTTFAEAAVVGTEVPLDDWRVGTGTLNDSAGNITLTMASPPGIDTGASAYAPINATIVPSDPLYMVVKVRGLTANASFMISVHTAGDNYSTGYLVVNPAYQPQTTPSGNLTFIINLNALSKYGITKIDRCVVYAISPDGRSVGVQFSNPTFVYLSQLSES